MTKKNRSNQTKDDIVRSNDEEYWQCGEYDLEYLHPNLSYSSNEQQDNEDINNVSVVR